MVAIAVLLLIGPRLAREIFPSSAANQFRLRFDAPDGTRVPVTEEMARQVLETIDREAGAGNIAHHPQLCGHARFLVSDQRCVSVDERASTGRHERRAAPRRIHFSSRPGGKAAQLLPQQFPGSHFSFDPGDLISQTLNFGTPSVIEVATTGPQYNDVLSYAGRVQDRNLQKSANCAIWDTKSRFITRPWTSM